MTRFGTQVRLFADPPRRAGGVAGALAVGATWRGLAATCVWLVLGALTFARPAGAAETPPAPLLAGCEKDYPPFCVVHPDGRVDGFSVELLRTALSAMGREADFRTGPWAEVKSWLERGEVTVLPLVGRTPEREAAFDFTVPYLTMHGAIVVRAGTTGVREMADLRGRRVGTMRGDNAEEFLRREDRGLEILPFPSFVDAFRTLSAGGCDAVVVQRLVALRLLAEHGLKDLQVVDRPITGFSQDFCFAVREGDRDTLALLNEGLALVVADGTHRRLHTKWFASLELPADRPLIIGGDYNYPPFEYLDEEGRPTGFSVELTRAIGRALNLNIQFNLGPWAEVVEGLRSGEVDAIQGMFFTPERDQTFDFSPRYAVIHSVSIVRQGTGRAPERLEDLAGRDLVVQAQDAPLEMLRESGIEVRVTTVATQEEVLRAVAEGRHECGVATRLGALHAMRKHGWTNLALGKQPLYSGDYCYAVPRGGSALLAQLSEGLQMLKQSGEYREIHEKWLGVYEPAAPAWRTVLKYLAWVALPLGLFALLALVWSWNLRRLVARRTGELAKANEELRATVSELRRAKVALDHVPAFVFIKDRDRRYVYANRATLKLFGCPAEELRGSADDRFFPPTTVARLREVDDQVLERGETYAAEIEALGVDGGKKVYWETKAPLYGDDGGGEVWGLCGISMDITQQKRAEEAVRRSELEYRLLFECNPNSMWIYDLETLRFLAVNDTAVARYGYTREEFLSMTIKDIRPPGDVARLLDDVAHSREVIQHRGGWQHRKKDGGVFLVEISSHALTWRGRSARVVMAQDVTERERAREALEASEARFRQAIVSSPFPILLHAEDGEILQVSQSWCELSGYPLEELRTVRDWTERAYRERQGWVQQGIDALFELDERRHEGDFSLRTRSGAERIWDFSSAPLGRLPDGRRVVITMAVDVTERRSAEQELQAMHASLLSVIEDEREAQSQVHRLNLELEHRVEERTLQLQEANRELEAFSYSVSHDLRAPLRHISGYVDLLRREAEPCLNEKARRYVRTIAESAREMGELIDGLLAFSRVGRNQIQRIHLDMNDFVRKAIRALEPEAAGRDVVWNIGSLPSVEADPELLRLVLVNLLSNALKYSRGRTPAIVEVGGEAGDRETVFFVRDNGVGFDMLYVDKLFGVFQRLHSANDFEGTGIGLANVRRIIVRHGGRTWAEGAVDQGATFYFSLPQVASVATT